MNVLSIGAFDAAGVQTTFAEAWTKYGYGEWRTYFKDNYLGLPTDISVLNTPIDEFKNIIDNTDIFLVNVVIDKGEFSSHLINDWDTIGFREKDVFHLLMPYIVKTNKPIIFFINGSDCVRKWSFLYQQIFSQITPYLAVSTPDLLTNFPNATYLPGFIDVEKPFWNLPHYKKDYLWIGQFPTNPRIKNTQEFIDMLSPMSDLNIKVDIINGVSHSQSINYRRDMDITFDHLGGYYGINSLESATLGVVNMVKLTPNNKKTFCEVAGVDTTPWDLVDNMQDVKKKILFYYNNRDALANRKKEVAEWMRNYWTPQKHLSRMEKYFEDIINNHEKIVIRRKFNDFTNSY